MSEYRYILSVSVVLLVILILIIITSIYQSGYHYTPKQYFTDNPWLRDNSCLFVRNHRKSNKQTNEQPVQEPPKLTGRLPRWSSRKRHARSKLKTEK